MLQVKTEPEDAEESAAAAAEGTTRPAREGLNPLFRVLELILLENTKLSNPQHFQGGSRKRNISMSRRPYIYDVHMHTKKKRGHRKADQVREVAFLALCETLVQ